MSSAARRVTIIGSGNWGSAIAKIVGTNTSRLPDLFHSQVCGALVSYSWKFIYDQIYNSPIQDIPFKHVF